MYVCMYVNKNVNAHVYTDVYAFIQVIMYDCKYVYKNVCMYIFKYVCMYVEPLSEAPGNLVVLDEINDRVQRHSAFHHL